MPEIVTVGLDLAKTVFQAPGADVSGQVPFRKKLKRERVLPFFSQLPLCGIAMEACGGAGAHLWDREIGKLGHKVELIPPAYVKPFVKRQKNNAAGAEATCDRIPPEQEIRSVTDGGTFDTRKCQDARAARRAFS